MSHWAELDENNKVLRVIVGNNKAKDEGAAFVNLLGGTWLKTSYNKTIRKNFAEPGGSYSPELDAFLPPKFFESWILDEETFTWKAPVPMPEDGTKFWQWNEETLSWDGTTIEEGN